MLKTSDKVAMTISKTAPLRSHSRAQKMFAEIIGKYCNNTPSDEVAGGYCKDRLTYSLGTHGKLDGYNCNVTNTYKQDKGDLYLAPPVIRYSKYSNHVVYSFKIYYDGSSTTSTASTTSSPTDAPTTPSTFTIRKFVTTKSCIRTMKVTSFTLTNNITIINNPFNDNNSSFTNDENSTFYDDDA